MYFLKVYFPKTFLTQSLPSPNFLKPSVPGQVRVFRALRACLVLEDLFDDIISCPHAEVTVGPFFFAKDFHSAAQQVVFHSLGCTRAWGQMEEPHAEPFAIVKEPFTIQIFPSFHDWKRIFLPWTLD